MKQERSFFLELIYQTKLAPSAGVNSNKEISLFSLSRSRAEKVEKKCLSAWSSLVKAMPA
jgi:hypothetical protein